MVGDLLQPTHLLFVLVVALLVLGPKRLPEVGRALGRGLRDFRHAMSGEEHPEQTLPHGTTAAAPAPPVPADEATVTASPEPPAQADSTADHEPVAAGSTKNEPDSVS
jgi:sec-independent protein translocase protein TatA